MNTTDPKKQARIISSLRIAIAVLHMVPGLDPLDYVATAMQHLLKRRGLALAGAKGKTVAKWFFVDGGRCAGTNPSGCPHKIGKQGVEA